MKNLDLGSELDLVKIQYPLVYSEIIFTESCYIPLHS